VRTPNLQSGDVNRIGRARAGLPDGDVQVTTSIRCCSKIKCPLPIFHLADVVLADSGERLEVVSCVLANGLEAVGTTVAPIPLWILSSGFAVVAACALTLPWSFRGSV
jgi:hypothetical protein